MDAYHYTDDPTMGEFIEKIKPFGIELVELPENLRMQLGEKITSFSLERKRDDSLPLSYPLPTEDLEQILHYKTVRSMCNALQVPMSIFGVPV